MARRSEVRTSTNILVRLGVGPEHAVLPEEIDHGEIAVRMQMVGWNKLVHQQWAVMSIGLRSRAPG
jgi:hypothetical protein